MSNGLCDDLLSCIARAWDFGQREGSGGKPVVLCPAMNTAMWDHLLTSQQLDAIRCFGKGAGTAADGDDSIVKIVEPMVKKLACGDIGAGALAELDDILHCVNKCLGLDSSHSNGNVSSANCICSVESTSKLNYSSHSVFTLI